LQASVLKGARAHCRFAVLHALFTHASRACLPSVTFGRMATGTTSRSYGLQFFWLHSSQMRFLLVACIFCFRLGGCKPLLFGCYMWRTQIACVAGPLALVSAGLHSPVAGKASLMAAMSSREPPLPSRHRGPDPKIVQW
jgi:hypothetical protein